MDNTSGVGVLDKAATVLGALEAGPLTLAGLVQATGLARPTAHRLATALEHHRFVARDLQGRFVLGPRLAELATAAGEDRLLAAAGPVLTALRDATGESCQLYRRQGDQRICVAAAERLSGLRDTVPLGAVLSMHAGSAAQVLLAWCVALGLSTTPKSSDPVRQAENLAAADLVLDPADVDALSALDGTEPDVTSPLTFGH